MTSRRLPWRRGPDGETARADKREGKVLKREFRFFPPLLFPSVLIFSLVLPLGRRGDGADDDTTGSEEADQEPQQEAQT